MGQWHSRVLPKNTHKNAYKQKIKKIMANLYKSHIILGDDKKILEYSTDEGMVNARIQELTNDTDLDTISFNIEHETALFTWTWTNQGGVEYIAHAQCDSLNEDTIKMLDKF